MNSTGTTIRSPLIEPWPSVRIHGQESFLLRCSTVELAVSSLGGMLAPVTFFPNEKLPIEPYHIAPWAREALADDAPPMLKALRGDWFCSAFGENAQTYQGRHLPPHGDSANRRWHRIAEGQAGAGSWLQLEVALPLQGGYCRSITALLNGHSLIYQRHDLSGLKGPINPGHHATLRFPEQEGCGRLSFSPFRHAQTYVDFIDGPKSRRYSSFRPNSVIENLQTVPLAAGGNADVTRFPARCGFDDIVIVCADTTADLAWTAVTFPANGYVWFALRNSKQLASTLLWLSNGGRRAAPWNGRHTSVMGIEDVTAFFHVGIAESCRRNALTDRGIRTCLTPEAGGRLSIPYIQGVARIPASFDRVASIEPGHDILRLRAESGSQVEIACHLEFLRTGTIPELELA